MTSAKRTRLGRGGAALSMATGVVAVLVHLVNGTMGLLDEGNFTLPFAVAAIGFGALVWIALPSQPRNGVVWALAGSALSAAIALIGTLVLTLAAPEGVSSYGELVELSPSELSTIGGVGAMLTGGTWVASLFLAVGVGLLLFPDGKPPSPRWQWLVWVNSFTIVGITLGLTLASNPNSTTPIETSGENFDGIAGAIVEQLFFPMVAGAMLAIVSLAVRYRRSSGVARSQIQWIALGGLAFLIGTVAADPDVVLWPMLAGQILFIAAFLIGITKYRLYDIDVIVSKSVTYVGLAAVITLVYAAFVVGPLLILGLPDEGGPGLALPIVATAIVALLFEPIRVRLQRWANRLVYGERATPHEVLSQVTTRLAESDAGTSVDDLAELLAGGTGANEAVVWLRREKHLEPAGRWPLEDPTPPEPVTIELLPNNDLGASELVKHGAELLGAVTIAKPADDPVTPADTELMADVAAGAGLLLRNISLNRQLKERARLVHESRRRLIAAQDAERHRLERNLHDGAQQQVVALKVKLGIARTIAEREEAHEIATSVAALADDTQQAVDSLRGVAHGIYPPLLEAEGLATALRAVERSAGNGLEIDSGELARYPREVETTAYFFLVEAAERARMSGSSFVRVDLQEQSGQLVIAIEHDGQTPKEELATVADRIDVLGGRTDIANVADRVTRITSRLPTALEPA